MLIRFRMRGRLYAFTLLLLALSAPAHAGPPFVTDDPEPVDFRHWEAYLATQYGSNRSGISGTAPHVEVNYGAVPNVQLHLIVPLAYSGPRGGSAQYGLGDLELGVKYRFVQETKRRPMVGIFPLVEVNTGDSSRGLGNGQAQFYLPVWFQKSWGPWTTYGGGGYWHNPGAGNRDYWSEGLLLQRSISHRLTVGGEIFHASSSTVNTSDRSGFNLGMIYDFDEGHHLLFSAGTDVRGPNTGSVYLGYQWTFGPHEASKSETIPTH